MSGDPNDKRRKDLEESIHETLEMIKEYEDNLRYSGDPKEKRKWRKDLVDLRKHLEEYNTELVNLESKITQFPVQKVGSHPTEASHPSTATKYPESYPEEFFNEIGSYIIKRSNYSDQEPLTVSYRWLMENHDTFQGSLDLIMQLSRNPIKGIAQDIETLLEAASIFSDLSDSTASFHDCFNKVSHTLSIPIDKVFPNNQSIRVKELASSISSQFSSIADRISWDQNVENTNIRIEPNLMILRRLAVEVLAWLKEMIFQIERIQELHKNIH